MGISYAFKVTWSFLVWKKKKKKRVRQWNEELLKTDLVPNLNSSHLSVCTFTHTHISILILNIYLFSSPWKRRTGGYRERENTNLPPDKPELEPVPTWQAAAPRGSPTSVAAASLKHLGHRLLPPKRQSQEVRSEAEQLRLDLAHRYRMYPHLCGYPRQQLNPLDTAHPRV